MILNLGELSFSLPKSGIQVTARASAVVSSSSKTCSTCPFSIDQLLSGDAWLSRSSGLTIILHLTCDSRFYPTRSEFLDHINMLSSSLQHAKLWAHLGFEAQCSTRIGSSEGILRSALLFIHLRESQVELSPTSTRIYSRRNDLWNVRSPTTIPMYSFDRIDVKLNFISIRRFDRSNPRGALNRTLKSAQLGRGVEESVTSLTDAVLRSLLTSSPGCIARFKKPSPSQVRALDDVAPFVFNPAYARAIASRSDLLPSITRMLRGFEHLRNTHRCKTPGAVSAPADDGTVDTRTGEIEGYLWKVMTRHLKERMSRPKLAPIIQAHPICGHFISLCEDESDTTSPQFIHECKNNFEHVFYDDGSDEDGWSSLDEHPQESGSMLDLSDLKQDHWGKTVVSLHFDGEKDDRVDEGYLIDAREELLDGCIQSPRCWRANSPKARHNQDHLLEDLDYTTNASRISEGLAWNSYRARDCMDILELPDDSNIANQTSSTSDEHYELFVEDTTEEPVLMDANMVTDIVSDWSPNSYHGFQRIASKGFYYESSDELSGHEEEMLDAIQIWHTQQYHD